MVSKKTKIDGQNIVYHYLQKVLFKDDEFSQELIKHLLVDLSIWLPPILYQRLPIILPYVVRDPSCRKNRMTGEDEWGSSNQNGFLRDDNSLIKGIVRSFKIQSSRVAPYNGKRLGNGFVASHIWREITLNGKSIISSRNHTLNSFIPNLVWLPVQISKFTDREGSIAQRMLQAISYKLYQKLEMPSEIADLWNHLPLPKEFENINIDPNRISFFVVPEKWIKKRKEGLFVEVDHILSIDKIETEKIPKVKSRRYLPSLKQIGKDDRRMLDNWLVAYRRLVQDRSC